MKIIVSSSTITEEILRAGSDLLKAYFLGAEIGVSSGQGLFETQKPVRNNEDIGVNTGGHRLSSHDENSCWAEIGIEAHLGVLTQIDFSWELFGLPSVPAEAAPSFPLPRKLYINLTDQEIACILAQPEVSKETQPKLLLKHGMLKLLSQVCDRQLSWGILTGIRPGKMMHRLYDFGFSREERSRILEKRYAIRADKVELLQEIASRQRPYLEELRANPQKIAVYIGIPFCPTRCTYCSFPGYQLGQERQELALYLKALQAEIREVGRLMKELGLVADTVYIGGGTPTTLTPREISRLIDELKKWLPWQECREFTVEAGRVDTLSREMLEVLKECGITRLSINPQTMQEATLTRIGRNHGVAEVVRVFELARTLSDWLINMDLILGLPGENLSDVQSTLIQLEKLQPDNLTVHMLALKRGSVELAKGYKHHLGSELEQMQELSAKVAVSWGLQPYYLYRQKRIAGNLENIGYARPGSECCYNISIIEERQTILGLGAGASTKIYNPVNNTLINEQHPTSWQSYVQHARFDVRGPRSELNWKFIAGICAGDAG